MVDLPLTRRDALTRRSGYKSSPFPLKADQQAQVTQILSETGFMPAELVNGEVDWFYGHLGLSNEFL